MSEEPRYNVSQLYIFSVHNSVFLKNAALGVALQPG